MTNAERFQKFFGLYATELWSKPEAEFLEWLNQDVPNTNDGDTISRQAAIDAIMGMKPEVYYPICFADRIKELPTADRWISVKDRLPEKEGVYLVTDHQRNVVRYVFHKNESSKDYWKRCVLAWQPLPEPYRPEEDA